MNKSEKTSNREELIALETKPRVYKYLNCFFATAPVSTHQTGVSHNMIHPHSRLPPSSSKKLLIDSDFQWNFSLRKLVSSMFSPAHVMSWGGKVWMRREPQIPRRLRWSQSFSLHTPLLTLSDTFNPAAMSGRLLCQFLQHSCRNSFTFLPLNIMRGERHAVELNVGGAEFFDQIIPTLSSAVAFTVPPTSITSCRVCDTCRSNFNSFAMSSRREKLLRNSSVFDPEHCSTAFAFTPYLQTQ